MAFPIRLREVGMLECMKVKIVREKMFLLKVYYMVKMVNFETTVQQTTNRYQFYGSIV